jgi:translation elongation factor EF-Ts
LRRGWWRCLCRRPKIVEGRIAKIAKEMALMEQAFIKDTGKTVAEHIKEAVATIGENIQVQLARDAQTISGGPCI